MSVCWHFPESNTDICWLKLHWNLLVAWIWKSELTPGLCVCLRRRMCWPMIVVMLAHLGATLTGAWRASQPRLQFTHSGKRQHFFSFFFLMFPVCLFYVWYISRSLILHTPTYAGDGYHTPHLIFHFPFFPLLLVPTHGYMICGTQITPLPFWPPTPPTCLCLPFLFHSNAVSLPLPPVITCIVLFFQFSSLAVKALYLVPAHLMVSSHHELNSEVVCQKQGFIPKLNF